MKYAVYTTIALFSPLFIGGHTALAQSPTPNSCIAAARAGTNPTAQLIAIGRAKNLARQAAEATNGGLVQYRADAPMHASIAEAPCSDAGDGKWTFTVQGQRLQATPAIMRTVVQVDQTTAEVTIVTNEVVTAAN
jgi:hypothetical protein